MKAEEFLLFDLRYFHEQSFFGAYTEVICCMWINFYFAAFIRDVKTKQAYAK